MDIKLEKIAILIVICCVSLSCSNEGKYYSLNDFEKVEKMDVHIHVGTNRDAFVKQARQDNFKLLNVVVDVSRSPGQIEKEYQYRYDQKAKHPEEFEVITAFSMEGWDEPDWVSNTISWLDQCFDDGAIGVKVWKNIGMVFRDKHGALVRIDDPKLDTVFDHIEKRGKVLMGHLGEPLNCWLPLEEMIVNNDKSYFNEHPEYHMYLHPEMPSYEDQIAARDRMLVKHPNLTFMGAHMGSLEHDVDELAKRLDRFPNMSVDLAARIGQVFYQTIQDREKVRNFFIKYQDRLMYATDMGDSGKRDAEALKKEMHDTWMLDWQFLVTDDWMASDRVNEKFQGLKLPKEVVDKIYSENARRWLKMFAAK
ncbi:MAG: amidohydrolase family protein [Cyclobacteriaceae bacterium]